MWPSVLFLLPQLYESLVAMHGIKKIIMQKNEMDPSKILVGRMQKEGNSP